MGLSERFAAELALIKDPIIREFARKGLDAAPDYLATCISSFSGHHHPPDERVEGGRALHIRRVARVTHELAQPFGWNDHHRDCMVAAALLHDIVVLGPGHKAEGRTWRAHDWVAAEYLDSHGLKDDLPEKDWVTITQAMKGHMGRWASKGHLVPRPNSPGHWLHMADYVASLPWVLVEPLP